MYIFWAQLTLDSLFAIAGPKKVSIMGAPNPSNGTCNEFARIKIIPTTYEQHTNG